MSNLGRLFFVLTVLTLQGLSLPAQDVFEMHTLGASRLAKRALDLTSYETYQISNGNAGTAKDAASKLLLEPLGLTMSPDLEILPLEKLKGMSKEDVKLMFKINHEGNVQEKEGFNPAIKAAKGDKDLLGRLKRGKSANKVLKLLAQYVGLSAQVAQGKTERKEKLEKEKKKLAKNIETDEKNKGKPMSSFLSAKSGSREDKPDSKDESKPASKDESKPDSKDESKPDSKDQADKTETPDKTT